MANSSDDTILYLIKLGLSQNEAKAYHALLKHGSLTATSISRYISVFPNAVYRLMGKLIKNGFVIKLETNPQTFQAIPSFIAIENYVNQRSRKLEETKLKVTSILAQDSPKTPPTKMELISSRKHMFETHVKYMKKIKKEALIISIGEPIPDEIKLAHRDAIERGATIKLLVHKYNKSNERLLKSWVAMKTEVRHLSSHGYHMMVYDGKTSILVANNPKNTAERNGFIISSPPLSKTLREYFYSLWERALVIEK